MILEKIRLLIVTYQRTQSFIDFLLTYLKIKKVVLKTKTGLKTLIRPNGIDYWLYIENLIDDTYSLASLKFLDFDNIVDIGANIGLFTIATKKYWPKAKRLCFEPNPRSRSMLKKNLELNKLKVLISDKAVIGKIKKNKVVFYTNENPAMSSMVVMGGKKIKVSTIPFSEVIPSSGKTLVKIDIEGGEYDLFRDDNKSIFKKIGVLLMETHDIDEVRNDKFVLSWLKNIGFKVYYENRNIIAINTSKISF